MVFRQVVRPQRKGDLDPHEHDATEVSGVFGFLRALKAKIDGSVNVTDTITVDPGGAISIGGEVPAGASSQFFIHNTQSHLILLETDDPAYPDNVAGLDVQDLNFRLLLADGVNTYSPIVLRGPTHAQANDIELRDSNDSAVLRWNDQGGSAGFWEIIGDVFHTGDMRSDSFRMFPGPDTSDFYLWAPADSGDSVVIQQWDQSAATAINRVKIIGTGTAVTDTGDILLYDGAGAAVAQWDDSANAWIFPQGVLQAEDGAVGAPAYGFNAGGQTDVGFYRAGTDQIGVTANGANVATFQATAGHNLAGLAWTTYTPTVTADGGSPTAGNATLAGRYIRIGNMVHVAVDMTLGNTTNFGTGTVYMSLPVAALDNSPWNDQLIGMGIGVETGAVTMASCHVQRDLNADRVKFLSINDAAATPANFSGGSAVPFTWGTGDILRWTATYEAA